MRAPRPATDSSSPAQPPRTPARRPRHRGRSSLGHHRCVGPGSPSPHPAVHSIVTPTPEWKGGWAGSGDLPRVKDAKSEREPRPVRPRGLRTPFPTITRGWATAPSPPGSWEVTQPGVQAIRWVVLSPLRKLCPGPGSLLCSTVCTARALVHPLGDS